MRRATERPVEAAGLLAALDLLTAPYAAAAGTHVVPLVDSVVDVPATRAPAVLVRLRTPLDRRAVVVRCGGVPATPPAVFTAWSAAGSLLPLFVPDLHGANGSDAVGPLHLTVTVRVVDGPAAYDPSTALVAAVAGADLAATDATDLVEALVVEGRLARTIYLLTAEKQRIVAVSREIAASRHVSLARSGALDRSGADHGVPRLAGEDDDAYRARLRMMTSWWLATPAGFERALNGVPDGSADGGPNTGLPSTVGVDARFRVVDQVDRLAVSVRMVEVVPPGVAGGTWRQRFLDLARGGLLLDLEALPPTRLPDIARARLLEVRRVLRANLDRAQPVTERRYLAAGVAASLARAVRALEALTGSGALTLRSAMTRDVDPRLDLGLGVTIDPLEPARVDAAVAAARAAQQDAAAGIEPGLAGPPDVVGAVLGAQVRDRPDDPAARWLFAAAGLDATPLGDGSLHLTSLPSQGLYIEGPGVLEVGATASYIARIHGGGLGRNVLVDEAWARAAPNLAHGGSVPAALDPAALDALLEQVAAGVADIPEALRPLVGDGLIPAVADQFAARVREAYDGDLLLGVVVDPRLAGLSPDDPAAVASRQALVADLAALTAAGFHAVRVLPHPDGTHVLVLASVSGLPGGSNRPGEPAPAAYRWYATPFPPPDPARPRPLPAEQPVDALGGGTVGPLRLDQETLDWSFRMGGPRLRRPQRWTPAPLEIRRGLGGRAVFVGNRPGIALVVCVAHIRRGAADPYEVRVELPEGAVLDLDQYGYVMNLLEELCPLGVEINTFQLRRNHVSPDGGPPQFLSGRVSRGYTRYRRRRAIGTERHGPPG
ncbi:MAG TPA: hypothetical protein VFX60_17620 [Micromonospora sp.]|nr:hypothetical protein [Micromonospora sp.]